MPPGSLCCPFCGHVQAGGAEALQRCPSCNLYVAPSDLVAPGEPVRLDGVSRDFCPWCAFPVAREASLPENEEFICPGCSGTLNADTLETQAAIDAYRHRGLAPGGYVLFVFMVIAIIAATLLWILP